MRPRDSKYLPKDWSTPRHPLYKVPRRLTDAIDHSIGEAPGSTARRHGVGNALLLEFRLLRVSELDQSLGILSILHQECGEGRRVRGSRHDSLLI